MAEAQLQPWSEDNLPLLQKLLGDPARMTHLGGPESLEQILRRHRRYVSLPGEGTDPMFKIVWGRRKVEYPPGHPMYVNSWRLEL